jgi:hypothetical protein
MMLTYKKKMFTSQIPTKYYLRRWSSASAYRADVLLRTLTHPRANRRRRDGMTVGVILIGCFWPFCDRRSDCDGWHFLHVGL